MGMRVLVTSPAMLGHVHPMVPLAEAIAARGHEVLWALPADGVEEVGRRGIQAVAAAPTLPIGPGFAKQRYPELDEPPAADVPEFMFGKLWGAILAPEMLAGLCRWLASGGRIWSSRMPPNSPVTSSQPSSESQA
jgi:UDP:flavonoid glycosyltransferase YjiC (YdhE family)